MSMYVTLAIGIHFVILVYITLNYFVHSSVYNWVVVDLICPTVIVICGVAVATLYTVYRYVF